MPIYGWKRMSEKSSVLRELPDKRAEAKKKVLSREVTLDGADYKTVHFCTLCGEEKLFPVVGLLASHFNRMHNDKVENKDSWREYHGTMEMKISEPNS